MNKEAYLEMQRRQYEHDASLWSLSNKDAVVGSYDAHDAWPDYDTLLFKDFDTTGKIAMEYGCGPGRNLIHFANRFGRIDGVDIAQNNINAAQLNLEHNGIPLPNLIANDGSTMPMIADDTYDVVFSVICLQHIASHDIRFSIMSEIFRVLKPGGRFCFQMGFGGRSGHRNTSYFDNGFDAIGTNGWHDVEVETESQLSYDLLDKIGFVNYKSDIAQTGPGDQHLNWIWVQVEKPDISEKTNTIFSRLLSKVFK